jgi:hypothetical protein
MRYELSEYAEQVQQMDPEETYSVIQAKKFIINTIPLLPNDIDAQQHVLETCIYTSIHHAWPRHVQKSGEAQREDTAEGVDLDYNPKKAHPAWHGKRWIKALSTPAKVTDSRPLIPRPEPKKREAKAC